MIQPNNQELSDSDRSVLRSLMPEPVREAPADPLKSPHPPKGATGPSSQRDQSIIDPHPELPPGSSGKVTVIHEQSCPEDGGAASVRGTYPAPVKAYRRASVKNIETSSQNEAGKPGLTWLQYAARRVWQGRATPDHKQASFGASLGRRHGKTNNGSTKGFAGAPQFS